MSGLLLGSIRATMNLDNSGFLRPLAESEAMVSTFGQTFATAVHNPLLAGIGALKSFGSAVASASAQLLGMAEGVARTSALTGVSVETIQSLRNVLSDMGLSAEGADAALTAFNRKLGDAKKDGGATAKSLAQLGVDITNVGTGERALRAIFDQLSRIQDVGQRAAAAAEIFDRQFGAQLLSAVNGGAKGIDDLNAKFLGLGRTLDGKIIGTLDGVDARIDSLKGKLEGAKNVLTAEFLQGLVGGLGQTDSAIGSVATSMKNDLAPAAKALGDTMGQAVDGLRAFIELVAKLDQKLGGSSRTNLGTETRLPSAVSQWEFITNGLYGNYGAAKSTYGISLEELKRGDRRTGLRK